MMRWMLMTTVSAFVIAGGALWLNTQKPHSDDPFENAFAVVTAKNFGRSAVPGRIMEYTAPAVFDIMTNIDWGEESVNLETNLPIEAGIYGGFDDNLTVRCAQVAFSVADEHSSLPGRVGWPPVHLVDLARQINVGEAYMRRCEIQIGPIDGQDNSFAMLVHRCRNAIQAQLPGPVETKRWNEGASVVKSTQPVETPHGTLIEATCWHNSVRPHLHFETWFLINVGR